MIVTGPQANALARTHTHTLSRTRTRHADTEMNRTSRSNCDSSTHLVMTFFFSSALSSLGAELAVQLHSKTVDSHPWLGGLPASRSMLGCALAISLYFVSMSVTSWFCLLFLVNIGFHCLQPPGHGPGPRPGPPPPAHELKGKKTMPQQ